MQLEKIRVTTQPSSAQTRSNWMVGWLRSVMSYFEARIGLAILAMFALAAASHPVLLHTVWPRSIYDPRAGFDPRIHHPSMPTGSHFLGTDAFGKDTFSMLLAGTRPALVAGVLPANTALVAWRWRGECSLASGRPGQGNCRRGIYLRAV